MEGNTARKISTSTPKRNLHVETNDKIVPDKYIEFYFGKIGLIIKNYPSWFLLAITLVIAGVLLGIMYLK